jgi:chromosome segregation ATPase
LWRSLFIGSAVERLAAAHHAYCAELDYSCGADPQLVAAQADANWLALIWPQAAEKLRAYRPLHQERDEARDELRRLEEAYAAKTRGNEELIRDNAELWKGNTELVRSHAELAKGYKELLEYCRFVERSYQETQTTLQATRNEYVELKQAEQERLRGLGPTSLAMARWLAGITHRVPGATSIVKRLLHLEQPENSTVKKAG